jgi:Uma2 family endonuclease
MLDAVVHLPRSPIRPVLRKEYERLVEQGMFQRERVELIRGFIVQMRPIGPRHAETVRRLQRLLARALGDRAIVDSQNPFAAGEQSEPEPDVKVIPDQDYSNAHPAVALLMIEVADTSLEYDRTDKASLYAEAGEVREYWIVNLVDDVVEVHRDPDARGHWRSLTTIARGGSLSPAAFPDVVLRVDDFLP